MSKLKLNELIKKIYANIKIKYKIKIFHKIK